jgi:hypothetical protein
MSLECNNDSDLNEYDKRNMVVVLLEGMKVYYCYNRDDFNKIILSEYEKDICIQVSERNAKKLLSEPVFKEPYYGVFVDKSLIAFQHHDCLLLYKRGNFALRSEFGVGNIHGAVFPVYSVFPLSLEKFLERRGSVEDFTGGIISSLTPEIKEKLNYDVQFILMGGAIDFVGKEYRRALDADGDNVPDYVAMRAQQLELAEAEQAARARQELEQNASIQQNAVALQERRARQVALQAEEEDEEPVARRLEFDEEGEEGVRLTEQQQREVAYLRREIYDSNREEGADFSQVYEVENIQEITPNMRRVKITGFRGFVQNLPNIKTLFIDSIDDNQIFEIKNMPSLERLYIENNIPIKIENVPKLRVLTIVTSRGRWDLNIPSLREFTLLESSVRNLIAPELVVFTARDSNVSFKLNGFENLKTLILDECACVEDDFDLNSQSITNLIVKDTHFRDINVPNADKILIEYPVERVVANQETSGILVCPDIKQYNHIVFAPGLSHAEKADLIFNEYPVVLY